MTARIRFFGSQLQLRTTFSKIRPFAVTFQLSNLFFLLISLLVLPLQKKLTASVARRREEEEEEEGNDKDRVKEFLGRAE